MEANYKDFNEMVSQLRLAIDNEVCTLFRNAKLKVLDFSNDTEIESLSISEETENWRVKKIEYSEEANVIVIHTESGFETDFTDCNTDDMISVYDAVYYKVSE